MEESRIGKQEKFEIDFTVMGSWLSISAYGVGNGCFVAVFDDITERKRAEEKLREANQHLRIYERLVESSPNLVALVDRDYVYRMANAAYIRLRGGNRGAILGHTVEEVLGKEDLSGSVRIWIECVAGEVVRYGDWFSYPDVGGDSSKSAIIRCPMRRGRRRRLLPTCTTPPTAN